MPGNVKQLCLQRGGTQDYGKCGLKVQAMVIPMRQRLQIIFIYGVFLSVLQQPAG